MSGAIGEPNLRNALPLSPTTLAVELSKPREFSYSRPSCKRLKLRDRAKQREVHGAMVPKLRGAVNGKDRGQDKIERGGRALRSSASRNGPFGLCQAESFGNSFADSVSFRFPSWQSLDGLPVPPAKCAPGYVTPAKEVRIPKNKKGTGRLQACPPNASPSLVSCCTTAHRAGNRCLVGGEHIGQLPGRLNSHGLPKPVTAPSFRQAGKRTRSRRAPGRITKTPDPLLSKISS